MRLIGYIRELKANSFTIPIYGDGDCYYHHVLDEYFNILKFEKIEFEDSYFKKIYISTEFDLNSKGAIAFVGCENHVVCNRVNLTINEIIHYLNETTENDKFLNVKKEAFEISTILKQEVQNITNNITVEQYTHIKHNDDRFPKSIVQLDGIDDISLVMSYNLYNHPEHDNKEYYSNTKSLNSSGFITKKIIESIFDDNLKDTKRKELLYNYFFDYLSKNKLIVNDLITNSHLSDNFFIFLSSKSNLLTRTSPLELTIEESLRIRSEERRRKMKELNYKFDNLTCLKAEHDRIIFNLDFTSPTVISQGSFTLKTEEKDNTENNNQTDSVIKK
jgi:hypothetical protein